MARPAKFDREKAVEFAMDTFWKDGYRASSVKALSERLGITRSSFYNAFGSRERLFNEAFTLYLSRSPDKALQDAEPGVCVKLLFSRMFRTVCAVRAHDNQARGCLAINGVTELCGTHAVIGPKLQKAMLANIARIETLLGWAVVRGEIDPNTDIHALALSVKSLLVGLNVLSKLVHDEDELWLMASTTLRALGLLETT